MPYHLLLIDGLNLLRRCYEANPAPDSAAKAESAVSAARHSFQRALRDHEPSHCLAVFDAGGPTWRHALYADYKADRKPMSPYLAYELACFRERLTAEHWAVMSVPGEEADDTLWGLAKAARFEGESVTVLSTDKDMARLVAIGAKVYHHFDRKWHDEAWCKAKFGVRPDQLTDFLALMGDSSDGIPGVAGVGAKTAATLLEQHGNLAMVLLAAKAGGVPGKLGQRLLEQEAQARLSFQLAELRSSFSPLDLFWDELVAPAPA